jgi:hypothetical protein
MRLLSFHLAWTLFAIFSVAAFAFSYNNRYSQLTGVSIRLRFALADLGLTERFLADWISTSDIIMMSGSVAIALVLITKKFDDWMAVFVSLVLFVYGVTITRPYESFIVLPTRIRWLLFTVRMAAIWYFLVLCYLFPDGRFVPRWTRYLAILWGVICLAWLFFPAAPFNLVYIDPGKQGSAISLILFLGWMGTGIYAQVYRFLKVSDLAQRQQTKLVVFGIAASILGLVAFLLPASLVPSVDRPGIPRLIYVMIGVPALYFATLLVPISITISILRYRLWDIDVIIRRTVVYTMLTIALALTYFGSVIFLQNLIHYVTGETSQIAIVISTLGIAVLFTPFRRRIQSFIDRRFYRRRYDMEHTVEAFAETLRGEVDLDRLSDHLVEVVRETMQPESVWLWMRTPAHNHKVEEETFPEQRMKER